MSDIKRDKQYFYSYQVYNKHGNKKSFGHGEVRVPHDSSDAYTEAMANAGHGINGDVVHLVAFNRVD